MGTEIKGTFFVFLCSSAHEWSLTNTSRLRVVMCGGSCYDVSITCLGAGQVLFFGPLPLWRRSTSDCCSWQLGVMWVSGAQLDLVCRSKVRKGRYFDLKCKKEICLRWRRRRRPARPHSGVLWKRWWSLRGGKQESVNDAVRKIKLDLIQWRWKRTSIKVSNLSSLGSHKSKLTLHSVFLLFLFSGMSFYKNLYYVKSSLALFRKVHKK